MIQSFHYEMIQTTKEIEDAGTVTLYGISVTDSLAGDSAPCWKAEDISSQKEVVAVLLERMQRNQVTPDTAEEVTEDYLAEIYGLSC